MSKNQTMIKMQIDPDKTSFEIFNSDSSQLSERQVISGACELLIGICKKFEVDPEQMLNYYINEPEEIDSEASKVQ